MSVDELSGAEVEGPSDRSRIVEVLRRSPRPRTSVEIAGVDPALAQNRLQLLVALDDLVGSGSIAKRFDSTAQAWRYSLVPPRRGTAPSGARSIGRATR